MTTYSVEFTEDSLPEGQRKCDKHNYWIKTREIGRRGGVRIKQRMCMMCEQERMAKEQAAAPKNPVKLRIMKI